MAWLAKTAPPVRVARRTRFTIETLEARLVLDGGVPAGLSLAQANWFYKNTFAASASVPVQWNGDVTTGDAGSLGASYSGAIVARINAYRWMAGLAGGVTANNPTENANAQQAALMMSVNRQLNHFPPASWVDYTPAGADGAGHSNLAIGVAGTGAIDLYMSDPGSSNTPVGHRRWLLDAATQTMGVGDIPIPWNYALPNSPMPANAVYVVQPYGATPEPSVGAIAWPPAGFVPAPLMPDRWSLQTDDPNADFSRASVSVTENGVAQQVEILSVNGGYAGSAIVWDMPSAPAPAAGQQAVYAVRVDNVLINGQPQSFSYTTTSFDPSTTTAIQPVPAEVQLLQSAVGTGTSASSVVVQVARSMDASQAVTVHYATVDGSAHAGVDYAGAAGTVTFAPGQFYATITVPLVPGAQHAGRTFSIALSGPNGALLGPIATTQVDIGAPSSGPVNPIPTPSSAAAASIVGAAQGGAIVTLFVNGPLDQASATNVAHYRLIGAGRDGVLGTSDDVTIPIRSVAYNAGAGRVTVAFRGRLNPKAPSEIVVSGLVDQNGNAVDGGSYAYVFTPKAPRVRVRHRRRH